MEEEYSENEKRSLQLSRDYLGLTKDTPNLYEDSREVIEKRAEISSFFELNKNEGGLIRKTYQFFLNWETFRDNVRTQRKDAIEELKRLPVS